MPMNKTIKNGLLILIPSAITFVIGWKIGTLQGAGISIELHDAAKSTQIIYELNLLRSNKINELIEWKEISLDTALLSHSIYLEESHGWIVYPFNKMYDPILEKSLSRSAEYRKIHPRLKKRSDMSDVYQRVDKLLEGSNQ